MKTIYVTINGIATQVLDSNKFQLFNWFNFKKGDEVYIDGVYFATFVSYEKSEIYDDETIKLEINA
jgi:hypothetical protein